MLLHDAAFFSGAEIYVPKVLAQKDHTKWNFDTVVELVEGPFLVPKRVEEAIRVRFIRRVMSFYHPFSHRFSDMPRNKVCWTTGLRARAHLCRQTKNGSDLAAPY